MEIKVLVVEDESKLTALIRTGLAESFKVSVCETFPQFESHIAEPSLGFDIIVLDRIIHGIDTLAMVPRIKEQSPQCKIIILSAINSPDEKILALDLGADDYVSKPFVLEELAARIRAVYRRAVSKLRVGNISLDPVERIATVGDHDLQLSNKEFLLLRTFLQFPRKVFAKSHLHEAVWQVKSELESNAVEATINNLRRKLEEALATPKIRNSRNLGYWIEE